MSEFHGMQGVHVGARAGARAYFGSDDPRSIRRFRYIALEIDEPFRLRTFRFGKNIATSDELIAEHRARLVASAA